MPSEVNVECSEKSDPSIPPDRQIVTSGTSSDVCYKCRLADISITDKEDVICSDVLHRLKALSVHDTASVSANHVEDSRENEELSDRLENLSLSLKVNKESDNLEKSTAGELQDEDCSKQPQVCNTESSSLQESDGDSSRNRDQPQEHEDVNEGNELVLTARGPSGGVAANQPTVISSYTWPSMSGYNTLSTDYHPAEPPRKFIKPVHSAFQYDHPACGDNGVQISWPWSTQLTSDLHYTSPVSMTGGSVAVQSSHSADLSVGLPTVYLRISDVSQQSDSQEIFEECVFSSPATCENVEDFLDFSGIVDDQSKLPLEGCDVASTADTLDDVGYYSPSNMSSPWSVDTVINCASPDNLSNDSEDVNDRLELITSYIAEKQQEEEERIERIRKEEEKRKQKEEDDWSLGSGDSGVFLPLTSIAGPVVQPVSIGLQSNTISAPIESPVTVAINWTIDCTNLCDAVSQQSSSKNAVNWVAGVQQPPAGIQHLQAAVQQPRAAVTRTCPITKYQPIMPKPEQPPVGSSNCLPGRYQI
jgi:hypothetical protein